MSGLSFIDIIRGKHKRLINDFHDSIWVNVPMDQVQEVEKLPTKDDKKWHYPQSQKSRNIKNIII